MLPSKFGEQVMQGDLFRHLTAGAGGWGDPVERDPAAVARDVRNGKLSAEYARREYRVVVREDLPANTLLAGARKVSIAKWRAG